MVKKLSVLLAALFVVFSTYAQNSDREVRSSVSDFFSSYQSETDIRTVSVKKTVISHNSRTLSVTLSDNFARQQFRPEMLEGLYNDLRDALPASLRDYHITLTSNGKDISTLVPNRYRKYADQSLMWNGTGYTEAPWKYNESAPYHAREGLNGTHLSVTPSHGYYFDNTDEQIWKWQRPSLWCTREDLLTQSFVYPYLIPMLENAGAVVTSMRERDWQTGCVTVDDQNGKKNYKEESPRRNRWKTLKTDGYSTTLQRIANDNSATVRVIHTGSGRSSEYASAEWIPDIPEDGRYAVYVTYHTFSNSVTDARYTVYHNGGQTVFRVNQKIGGGTWLYLGTFEFDKGVSESCMVVLDNVSDEDGMVCADAVRFGGGFGNEERGGTISGKARYLEGSRYYARFSGAPDSVFLKYNGTNDYNEDIQTRPRMTNWLSGGSVYNPDEDGVGVPIELSFALHTDAGIRTGDSIVGSLGICTTQLKNGILGTGMSRQISRDLTDQMLTELGSDLTTATGRNWTIRGVKDDNYCESREPQVQSTLLELLSHQNFYDLKYAYDPNFRFVVSRALYKAILKHVSFTHGRGYTVQPLPVSHFMIQEMEGEKALHLSWQPVTDPSEPSARPDGYIVYTSIDGLAADNGKAVKEPFFEIRPDPGHIYSFYVTAVNDGGQSMPSETLSAYIAGRSKGTILIVNGFQRLSGPETIETATELGFDLTADAGVQYMKSPIFSGVQKVYDRSHVRMEDEQELGFSGDEMDGALIAGNTFNYPYIHGKSIAAMKEYSFVSCSREAVEDSLVTLSDYPMTDIILGLQKHTANDTIMGTDYSTFTLDFMQMVMDYYNAGGRILVSGSYVGSDLSATQDGKEFARDILKFKWSGTIRNGTESSVNGLKDTFGLVTENNSTIYSLTHPDIIEPADDAIAVFAYSSSHYSAGIAYRNDDKGCVTLGFPLESIRDEKQRAHVMSSLTKYLME